MSCKLASQLHQCPLLGRGRAATGDGNGTYMALICSYPQEYNGTYMVRIWYLNRGGLTFVVWRAGGGADFGGQRGGALAPNGGVGAGRRDKGGPSR